MADKSSSEFTNLVYTLLIAEERGSVKDVAATLGLKEQSLYSRIYGRVRFSADEARALLRAVPDSRLADYLLDGTAFTVTDLVGADSVRENAAGATTVHLECQIDGQRIEARVVQANANVYVMSGGDTQRFALTVDDGSSSTSPGPSPGAH